MRYAGDVTPKQAWELLSSDSPALLVDVRTRAEWTWVGVPDLGSLGAQVVAVEWSRWPDGSVNSDFVTQVRAAGVDPGTTLLMLCRSGARSQHAASAATSAGLVAYNVSEGFEGGLDAQGHRGVGGWKAAGLPWRQT